MVSRLRPARATALSEKILATCVLPPAICSSTVGQPSGSTHALPALLSRSWMMDPSCSLATEVTAARRAVAAQVAGSAAVAAANGDDVPGSLRALMSLVKVCSA